MAREREDDRAEGRPERGLFTGRGARDRRERKRVLGRPGTDEMAATDGRESDEWDDDGEVARERGARPRTGAKRTVLRAIQQIPSYIRLLFGLMADSRVSRLDRFFVVAAAAYIVSPLDFIPDFIPFLGEVDDIFLLMLALQRLVENTGRRVLMDHWRGDPDELSEMNLAGMVSAAGFFLPSGIRRRLKRMARRRG
jgi:uncharacterized membrane protein YkvA (DUF1232 family)